MDHISKHKGQLDIYNPQFDGQKKIVIIWAGWIWSTTAYALAQMWCEDITVVDYDKVELHNTASQFYKTTDIGNSKVEALYKNVFEFTWVKIETIYSKFNPEMVKDADIVIMAVDNMKTRMEIAEACTNKTIRFIDCRMAAMAFEIHMFIPIWELELYKATWYSDEEASPVTCTNKSVSFNCLAIASIITRIVKGIIKNEEPILKRSNWQIDLHNLLIW